MFSIQITSKWSQEGKQMFKSMKIGLRIGLGFGIVIILMTAMGLFAVNRLGALDKTVNSMVTDRWPKSVEGNEIIQVINEMARAMHNALLLTDAGDVKKELQKVAEARNEVTKKIEELTKTTKSEVGKANLKSIADKRSGYTEAQDDLIRMIESGMREQAVTALHTKLHPLQADYFRAVHNLVSFQSEQMEKAARESVESYSFSRTMIMIVLGGSLALAIFIVFFVTRSITKPLSEAVAINNKLAEGDLSVTVDVDRSDEVGQLFAAMKNMVDKFKQITSDIDMLSGAAVQGKLATRADVSKHAGVYQKMVRGINDTLDAIIGPLNVSAEYVDRISKGDIPPKITDEYKGDFNEIKNNLNSCIDAVNALAADANMLAGAAVQGNLATRADASMHSGDYRKIVEGLNNIMSSIVAHLDSMPVPAFIADRDFDIRYMNTVGASLTGLSQQDVIGTKCYDHFKTPHCRTDKCAMGQCMQRGHSVTAETDAHPQGMDLDISYTGVPVKDTEGRIIGALEVVTDLTAVKSAARLAKKQADYQAAEVDKLVVNLEKIATGDLNIAPSAAATDEDTRAIGENLTKINDGLERTVQAIANLVQDADGLGKAAVEGKLATRADATKHQGDFRKIVESVNNTMGSIVAHLDSMPVPAFIADRDFSVRYMNAVGASLTGLSQQAVIGTKCYDHFKTPHCRTDKCAMGQCMQRGHNVTAETDAHPQGMDLDISYTGVPIKDTEGRIIGALEVVTDLTAVKSAARLAKKQADYQAAEVDRLVVNLEKVAGGDLNIAPSAAATDEDTRAIGENFTKINDGLERTVKAVASLVRDADGLGRAAVEGNLATRADATKHQGDFRKIVEGLNNTMGSIVAHLDSMPVPALIIDRDFSIRYMNAVGASLTGLSQQAVIGTRCYDHFKTSHCRTDKCATGQCMQRGHSVTAETDAHPQGMDLDISYSGVPVKDTEGRIIGALEVVTDLTAVKSAARLAKKQADYQAAEVDKLVVNLEKIARGDLHVTPSTAATDEDTRVIGENFTKINGGLERTVQAVANLVRDSYDLAKAAVEGKLATRADATKHHGDYRKIVEGVNDTLDAVIGPLNVAAEYVDRISKGDIPPVITDAYRGDFNEIKNNLNAMVKMMNELLAETDKIIQAAANGELDKRADANLFVGGWNKLVSGVNDTITNIVEPLMVTADYVEKVAKGINPPKITTEYKGQYNLIKNNLHMLIDAMEEVTTTAEEIASGNLTVKVKERSAQDKLMQALADMVASLTEVASNIQTAASQVMTGSQEMSASSEQLSQGATEQSASVEEVSASMEQMAANIKQNSDNAQQTEKIALKAATDGKEGGKSVSETVAAMKEIAGKISIIEEIARQTNLLALNAAIEAARAGEHGKGFAVVASEVRKLAERSQTAAAEINKLSASSVQVAEKAGEMLARMVPDIQKNADLVQEITAASNEQSAGAGQINNAIQQLDQVIQQNASASEEMASTSAELLSQAEQLQNTIAFFKLNGGPSVARKAIAAAGKQAKAAQKTHAAPKKTNGGTQPSGVYLNLSKEVKIDMADEEFERY